MNERGGLVTVAEAARLIGRSRTYAFHMLKTRVLPGVVQPIPGGEKLVRRSIVEAWLKGETDQSSET